MHRCAELWSIECVRDKVESTRLPSHCVCDQALNVEHVLSCTAGGLPSQRHNHIRDLTATLLSELASNAGVEPRLLPLSGEALPLCSANTDDQPRLDIEAYDFWGSHHERALFDVRVFNPFARSYVTSPIDTAYRCHERVKVREYEQRVHEIERASFTPLVFSPTGGMAPRAKVFYEKLSDLLAIQRKDKYSGMIALVRAMLNFSLLRDEIASLWGAPSAKGLFDHVVTSVDVAVCKSRVEVWPLRLLSLFLYLLFLLLLLFSLPRPVVYLFCSPFSPLYLLSLFLFLILLLPAVQPGVARAFALRSTQLCRFAPAGSAQLYGLVPVLRSCA